MPIIYIHIWKYKRINIKIYLKKDIFYFHKNKFQIHRRETHACLNKVNSFYLIIYGDVING
jgi:hypothetical protein